MAYLSYICPAIYSIHIHPYLIYIQIGIAAQHFTMSLSDEWRTHIKTHTHTTCMDGVGRTNRQPAKPCQPVHTDMRYCCERLPSTSKRQRQAEAAAAPQPLLKKQPGQHSISAALIMQMRKLGCVVHIATGLQHEHSQQLNPLGMNIRFDGNLLCNNICGFFCVLVEGCRFFLVGSDVQHGPTPPRSLRASF